MASIAWHSQRVQLAPVQSAEALKMLGSKVILDYQTVFPEEFVQNLSEKELREAASLQWVRTFLKTGKLAEMEAEFGFGQEYDHWRCTIPKVIKLLLPEPIDVHCTFLDRPRHEQMRIITNIDVLLEQILMSPYKNLFFGTNTYKLPEELLISMQEFMLLIHQQTMAQIKARTAPILSGIAIYFQSEAPDSKEDP
jgi:hypothetical protein